MKILSFSAALLLSLVLAGCGNDTIKESDSTDENEDEIPWGVQNFGSLDALKTTVTDANGTVSVQIGDSTPIMNMEANADDVEEEVVLEELSEIVTRKVPTPWVEKGGGCVGNEICVNALDSAIDSQLLSWMNDNEHVVKTLTEEPLKPLTGYYAYPYTVLSVGSSVTLELNLGLSQIEIPMKKVKLQKHISRDGEVSDAPLKEGYQGLAIIEYSNEGKVVSSEFYTSGIEGWAEIIQHALLNANIRQESNESGKSYENLTIEDWKNSTIKEVERIRADGRLPNVMVTGDSKYQSRGDFKGTKEIIFLALAPRNGEDNPNANRTNLRSYDGRDFSIDFKWLVGTNDSNYGVPMWIYIFTQDGRITTTMTQTFDGANMKFMAQGMVDAVDELNAKNQK